MDYLKDQTTFADKVAKTHCLFGFGLAGVNYEAETDPNVAVPSLQG